MQPTPNAHLFEETPLLINRLRKAFNLKMSTSNNISSLELEVEPTHSTFVPLPLRGIPHEASQDVGAVEQYLQPADRGPAAMKLLGAAFVFEALLWGKVFFLPPQKSISHSTSKGFRFLSEYFRITTPVFRSLPTIRIFPSWELSPQEYRTLEHHLSLL